MSGIVNLLLIASVINKPRVFEKIFILFKNKSLSLFLIVNIIDKNSFVASVSRSKSIENEIEILSPIIIYGLYFHIELV